MNTGSPSPRMQGVLPTTPRAQYGDSKRVNHVIPMEMFAVQYTNDAGKVIDTVVFKMGGQWYRDPNGEAWAGKLVPVPQDSYLAQQAEGILASRAPAPVGGVAVASDDAVDIMGGG